MSLDYFSSIENNSKVYRVVYNKVSETLIKSSNNQLNDLYNSLSQIIENSKDSDIHLNNIVEIHNNITNLHLYPEKFFL